MNDDIQQSLIPLFRRSPRRVTSDITTTKNRSISKSRRTPSAVGTSPQKRKTSPSPEAPLDSPSRPRAMSQSSTHGHWFEALEILAQNGDEFQVSWGGINPSTGKQWEPTWVLSAWFVGLISGHAKGLYTSASPYLEIETGYGDEVESPNFDSK